MRQRLTQAFVVFFLCIGVFIQMNAHGNKYCFDQYKQEPVKHSDSCFSLVGLEGWILQSAYVAIIEDSVDLELILFANVEDSWSWKLPVHIGTVCHDYKPTYTQSVEYKEPLRTWSINIHVDGKVFLMLKEGLVPTGSPKVVFLKSRYQSN